MRHRQPAVRLRRQPQHQVGERQVGQQLPVADQQVQPLGLLRTSAVWSRTRSVSVGTTTLRRRVDHGPRRARAAGAVRKGHGHVVAAPLRMTPRRVRRATDRAAMPGFSIRSMPVRVVRALVSDSALVFAHCAIRSVAV